MKEHACGIYIDIQFVANKWYKNNKCIKPYKYCVYYNTAVHTEYMKHLYVSFHKYFIFNLSKVLTLHIVKYKENDIVFWEH